MNRLFSSAPSFSSPGAEKRKKTLFEKCQFSSPQSSTPDAKKRKKKNLCQMDHFRAHNPAPQLPENGSRPEKSRNNPIWRQNPGFFSLLLTPGLSLG